MNRKQKTVCFSGHRTEKLPTDKVKLDELKSSVYKEIGKAIEEDFDTFIFGACYGFDLLCAQQVLLHKRVIKLADPKYITIIAAVPFEEQASCWNEADRTLYFDTLAECDDVVMLNTRYSPGCYHQRNRYMVDRSSKLICYYDGSGGGTGYTIQYAKDKGIGIINLY